MGNGLRALTLVACIMAAVVVVLGAYTRLVDAGLGCPDWPGCYGFLTVPESPEDIARAEARFPDTPVEADKAWPEMVHRYFATLLGAVILALVVLAYREHRATGGATPLKLPIALLILVIVQGAFGAWTVTLKLWPQVVTAHLLGGFATLSLLWLLHLRLRLDAMLAPPELAPMRSHAMLVLVAVVVQVALGGWVTSNYAALACPDFPTCHGELWPPMDWVHGFNIAQSIGPNYLGGQLESDGRVAIQMAHRIGALIVLLVGAGLIWRLTRIGSGLAGWLGVALGVQIALGILNVVLVLPLAVATAHNAVGALVLLVAVTVNYRAFQAAR